MKPFRLATRLAGALLAASLAGPAAGAYELTIPALDYRIGPYALNGIPFANGFQDYLTLLNQRDGGIEGVKINLVSCETAYNTTQGVECYEKTKNVGESGALVFQPLSTGITYQLIPKSAVDQIPIFSMGYGRTSATDGRIFPWVFNLPATYWHQATVFIQYIAEREGGMDQLRDKKIALVYHNSAYGKEPIRTLEVLAERLGYHLQLLPVNHPGQEQGATWLQVRRARPDWVLLWGWGVMNQVAVKEAASTRYPMDRFIGVWWSGSENDVLPAGKDANGYLSGAFHVAGDGFPVHDEIKKYVYDRGLGGGERERIGEVLYNRGLVAAMWTAEAIRKAMQIHGTKEVRAPQVVEEIFEIVGELNRNEAMTFLLAEQNTRVALRYASYGYILENGRVVMDGRASALASNEDVKEFYLGLSSNGRRSFRDAKHYRRRKRWLA